MLKRNSYIRSWLWLDILIILVIVAFGYFFWNHAHNDPEHTLPKTWQWKEFFKYFAWHDEQGWHQGLLVKGLLTTLKLGIWSGLLALVVGLTMGIYLATHNNGLMAKLLYAILVFLRNTPPLVLLFLLYFLTSENTLSLIGDILKLLPLWLQNFIGTIFAPPASLDRMLAAVLTLGIYQGAYIAEIIRSGLQSLPQGQWDGAAALGFSQRQQLFSVLLPQALPIMIPPLTGQYISIFKDSALASLISVPELTFQGMEIVAITQLPFETWLIIFTLYLIISLLCSRSFALLENSLHWNKKNNT